MSATTTGTGGSSAAEGRLWSERPDDWAAYIESQMEPLYSAVLGELDPAGLSVLDVGCGAGRFLALASAAGAEPTGLDAAPALLAIARRRVPEAILHQGDIESLPFEDHSFDAVTGFNSFQYATNPRHALGEARRVVRRGGRVVVAVWGAPERMDLCGYFTAIRAQLPPPPPGTPGLIALSDEGKLATFARHAGLTPLGFHAITVPWFWHDQESAVRGLISSGATVRAIEAVGEQATCEAVQAAIAPYRRPDGSYRLQNEFVYLVAQA